MEDTSLEAPILAFSHIEKECIVSFR